MSIRDSPTKVEILPPGDEGESSKPKTPDLLLSEDGLGYGLRYFLKSFKYRGRGKEVSDLGNLIRLHSEWHSHLLPYYSFDQFVHKGATSRFVSRPLPKPKRSVKSGKVYGVASEDMDSLTFGAPKFLRHLMDPSSRKIPVMEFEVAKILQELQLTMDQFIDVCILSGCDYCDSIREDQISCDGFPYV